MSADGTVPPGTRALVYYGEIGDVMLRALAGIGGRGTCAQVRRQLLAQGQRFSAGQVNGGIGGLQATRPPRVRLAGRDVGRGRPGIWEVTPAGAAWLAGERARRREWCGLGWPDDCRPPVPPAWAMSR